MSNFTTWRSLIDGLELGAIPDSAILHYPFIERSDSTLVEEITDSDGTANGLTNTSGEWREGYAEEGDGTDDYGELTDWSEVNFGDRLTGEWGIAITFQTTEDRCALLGLTDADSWQFAVAIGDFGGIPDDTVGVRITDTDGNENDQDIIASGSQNDDEKYRLMVGGDGPEASDKILFLNGNEDTNFGDNDGAHTEAGNFTTEVFTHARNDGSGSPDFHANAMIDNIIVLDEKPTATVAQDDFNNQPWS